MILSEWARRWQIPQQAIEELRAGMGLCEQIPELVGQSEAAAQQRIKLQAPQHGARLWRNNNGATFDQTGRMIRYGLANDTKALSEKIKSSDLIGITPYTILPIDVGAIIGIFTSIEVKKPGWKYTGTPREQAQLAWVNLIISLGGRGQFATGPENVRW